MPGEQAPPPSHYLPPNRDHTQHIIDSQSGERIGTRFWAPFDNPDALVDHTYWFVLFSPDTRQRIQAAIIVDKTGQQQLIWAEDIEPQQLLTDEERTHILVTISSATTDQEIGNGEVVPLRWIRAYARGDKEDQGASFAAGAFTRMLAASDIDQGIIYTAAAVYEVGEPNVHILTEEMF